MTVKGMGSLRRKVQKMQRDLHDEVDDAVSQGAQRTAMEARRKVAESNTFFTGNLARSIAARGEPIEGGSRHIVAARVPYAAFVEYGTGMRGDPSAPPKFNFGSPDEDDWGDVFSGILPWVMGKPIFYGPRTRSVAAAITDTIVEEGTRPHPFMRPAWFTHKPQIVQQAGLAAKSVVRRG